MSYPFGSVILIDILYLIGVEFFNWTVIDNYVIYGCFQREMSQSACYVMWLYFAGYQVRDRRDVLGRESVV